jgi:uncharacterized Zn-binding protein involved in type VI secretion
MKRHTITLGASTSAGGKVISASSNASIEGVAIALEGDVIFCPACKSQGKILCIGPRIPETWNDRNVALENDLCVCGCLTPPRLVPNQSLRYQTVSESESGTSQTAATPASANTIFDDKYMLIDESTNEPMAKTEYAIRRANGHVEFGTTDEKGHTHLLATTAHAESIEIYS